MCDSPEQSIIIYCTFIFIKSICLSAQNGVNPDWEKKVVEYFKEKLKENNAPKWVSLLLLLGERRGGADFQFLGAVIHMWFKNI